MARAQEKLDLISKKTVKEIILSAITMYQDMADSKNKVSLTKVVKIIDTLEDKYRTDAMYESWCEVEEEPDSVLSEMKNVIVTESDKANRYGI